MARDIACGVEPIITEMQRPVRAVMGLHRRKTVMRMHSFPMLVGRVRMDTPDSKPMPDIISRQVTASRWAMASRWATASRQVTASRQEQRATASRQE